MVSQNKLIATVNFGVTVVSAVVVKQPLLLRVGSILTGYTELCLTVNPEKHKEPTEVEQQDLKTGMKVLRRLSTLCLSGYAFKHKQSVRVASIQLVGTSLIQLIKKKEFRNIEERITPILKKITV